MYSTYIWVIGVCQPAVVDSSHWKSCRDSFCLLAVEWYALTSRSITSASSKETMNHSDLPTQFVHKCYLFTTLCCRIDWIEGLNLHEVWIVIEQSGLFIHFYTDGHIRTVCPLPDTRTRQDRLDSDRTGNFAPWRRQFPPRADTSQRTRQGHGMACGAATGIGAFGQRLIQDWTHWRMRHLQHILGRIVNRWKAKVSFWKASRVNRNTAIYCWIRSRWHCEAHSNADERVYKRAPLPHKILLLSVLVFAVSPLMCV